MADRVKDRRVLITGAAGGIGRAAARMFCAEGADVALTDVDEPGVTEAARAIAGEWPDRRALPFALDVSDEGRVLATMDAAVQALGGLDIVVTCAAVRAYQSLAEASAESWETVLAVNLLGAQNTIRAALPILRRAHGASIVNVASVFAEVGRRGMGQYDATKAALVSLTRTLAAEEGENGIRVNAVCPGSVWTPYTASRAEARGMTEDELRESGAVPALIDRWAEPDEIAYPILWLASDEASFITGTCLMVDGGLSAT